MSQCVPSWDLDDASAQPRLRAHSNSSNSLLPDVPSLDYEVAELTWENGQLTMHGLGPPRVGSKPAAPFSPQGKYAGWEKPRAGTGTLESIVNQATCHVPHLKSAENGNDLAPWFDHRRAVVDPGGTASIAVTMDAFVPCNNNVHRNNNHRESPRHLLDTAGTRGTPAAMCSCKTNTSVSESTATCGGVRERRQVTATFDNGERELGAGGFTSTSLWSPENTSSGKEYTKTTSGEDHDSVCHSQSQREADDGEVGKKKGNGKSSVSTKRGRAAAIHNQSERRRRDKINQRMKTLQKLVPNSSKTDKASILDEVIEYLKQLQAQVQVMSRINMPQMMLPLALQQISMMPPTMPIHMPLMDFNSLTRAAAGIQPVISPPPAGMPPVIPSPAAFMPMPSWDMQQQQQGDRLASPPVMPDLLSTFLACQSQPMTMDAYSRLAAFYQQFQQGSGSGLKN